MASRKCQAIVSSVVARRLIIRLTDCLLRIGSGMWSGKWLPTFQAICPVLRLGMSFEFVGPIRYVNDRN
jgi:hypothetical protein